jgi:outer membrane protein
MTHRSLTVPSVALAACLLLTSAASALAQDPGEPPAGPRAAGPPAAGRALSLDDCVQAALHNSPLALSAAQSLKGAAEAAASAQASYWPSLGFSIGYSRWQRRIFLPYAFFPPSAPLPTIVGPTDDYAFSFASEYTLFDSGARKARLGAARAVETRSVADRDRTMQDLALVVHKGFYAYAAALENRAVARESLKRAEDHVRIAKERKAAGAVPLADVLRAQVNASDARLALVRAEGAVRTARGRLAASMGLPPETPLDVAPGAPDVAKPDPSGLQSALDRAQATRPAIEAADAGVEAARRQVASARSAWGPKVQAMASYGREDVAWYPQDTNWLVGVTVSIPIFTGFSRRHDEARAKAELARAEADRAQVALAVREEAWDDFSAYQEAYESVETSRALVAQARESQRLAKERYEVGAGTITDLLDSENALASAEASLVNARWSYEAARARFQWSTEGLILPPSP